MSSKSQAILTAIDNVLITQIAPGGRLDAIGSHFVMRTSADTPPEYGTATPLLTVAVLSESGEELAVPPIATMKELQVAFTVFTSNGGDTTSAVAANIIDLVETEFRQETFGLASWFDFISKSYSRTSIAPFSGEWNGQAEYICQYKYIDMIEECDFSHNVIQRTVSDNTEVTAGTTLSISYDELRIYGDVTLTSTPTIYPGYDGQRLTIVGTSDAAMPVIQDNSVLSGSAVHLQEGTSFTLGLNDSLVLVYNASQGIWREEGRSDAY